MSTLLTSGACSRIRVPASLDLVRNAIAHFIVTPPENRANGLTSPAHDPHAVNPQRSDCFGKRNNILGSLRGTTVNSVT